MSHLRAFVRELLDLTRFLAFIGWAILLAFLAGGFIGAFVAGCKTVAGMAPEP